MDSLWSLGKKYDCMKCRDKYTWANSYFKDIYPRYLDQYKSKASTLLEIGVYYGGSQKALSEYLPMTKVVGIDIDLNRCNHKEHEKLRYIQGDQSDSNFLTNLNQEHGPFDVVIDDGSHKFEHQVVSFETLWPHVKAGGYYFVEDLTRELDGKFFFEYVKHNVLILNKFVNVGQTKRDLAFLSDLKAVHFYPSLVVFEKE